MKRLLLSAIIPIFFSCYEAEGITLEQKTKEFYAGYIEDVEQELLRRADGTMPFCRVYDHAADQVRVSADQIVIRNLNEKDKTPGGITHDWIGTRMIPGANLEEVIDILIDYDSHEDIFGEVVESGIVEKSDDSMHVFLRFKKKKILTVVSDTHHKVQLNLVSPRKAQIFSRSTRINEVLNYGKNNEKILPEGEDRGFLWRMNTYWSLDEIEEGVIIECRSITLSREAPLGLNLIINPIINSMPRESLESLLNTLGKHLSSNGNGPLEGVE